MSCFYVHTKWLKTQKEMYAGAPRELQWLSDKRLERILAVTHVLEEVAAENHGDTVRALRHGDLLTQIDVQFIGLVRDMHQGFR